MTLRAYCLEIIPPWRVVAAIDSCHAQGRKKGEKEEKDEKRMQEHGVCVC
jgi:hypothetical protein